MALNYQQAVNDALLYGGTGASVGVAAGGPLGAGIGAGVGLLTGGLKGLFSDNPNSMGAKNDSLKKIASATPQQEQLHNSVLSQAMGMTQPNSGYQNAQDYYKRLLQPGNESFEQFAAPYRNQFNEEILPQIAEHYAGAGALSSSAFGQSIGSASAGLQGQLAQLFSQLQANAANSQTNQYNQLTQTGLNYNPFAYERQEGTQGFWGPFAQGAAQNLPDIMKGIESLFKKKHDAGIGVPTLTTAEPQGMNMDIFKKAYRG